MFKGLKTFRHLISCIFDTFISNLQVLEMSLMLKRTVQAHQKFFTEYHYILIINNRNYAPSSLMTLVRPNNFVTEN